MLKINKKVEYALIALKFMAVDKGGQLTTAREICQKFNIPFDPLAKVMQLLGSAHILQSVQGVKGGYRLARPLGEITYFEVNQLIEQKDFGSQCNGPRAMCEQFHYCNVLGPLHRLNLMLIHFYKEITLEQLLVIPQESQQKNAANIN